MADICVPPDCLNGYDCYWLFFCLFTGITGYRYPIQTHSWPICTICYPMDSTMRSNSIYQKLPLVLLLNILWVGLDILLSCISITIYIIICIIICIISGIGSLVWGNLFYHLSKSIWLFGEMAKHQHHPLHWFSVV